MKISFEANLYQVTLCLLATILHEGTSELCPDNYCEYNFEIFRLQTMTYKFGNGTYNVGYEDGAFRIQGNSFHSDDRRIGSEVRDDGNIVWGDGVKRNVISINGQFPGPTIEVMEGTEISVRVVNHLRTEAVSIHWHGLHMRGNPWMDGVPYITQCPILPKQTFTYRFLATPPGTHWYHSHSGNQRLDGLHGMLLVHPRLPSVPHFPVSIADWTHQDAETLHVTNPYDAEHPGTGEMHVWTSPGRLYGQDSVELSALGYQSALINGRGRFGDTPVPLAKFVVKYRRRSHFHIVHAGAEYTFELSIDNHKLLVLSSDGSDIEPLEVDSLIIFPGETYDVEILANQRPGVYAMRARTLRIGKEMYPKSDGVIDEVRALVIYENAAHSETQVSGSKLKCTQLKPCRVLNCPFQHYAYKYNKTCIGFHDASIKAVTKTYQHEMGLTAREDEIEEIFLNFAFVVGSSINARKFVSPSAPFHQDIQNNIVECPSNCSQTGCRCTHNLEIPSNKTIQMVLSAYDPNNPNIAHHSVHLHGYNFAVVSMGYGVQNLTTGWWTNHNRDLECNNHLCSQPYWKRKPDLNLRNPPVKTTVVIPARGYTVIRFRSNNPGHWRFHCHQELHLMEGMDMIVSESPHMIPQPPKGFPTCGNFEWERDDFKVLESKGSNDFTYKIVLSETQAMIVCIAGLAVLTMFIICCMCFINHQCKQHSKEHIMTNGHIMHKPDIHYSKVALAESPTRSVQSGTSDPIGSTADVSCFQLMKKKRMAMCRKRLKTM